MKTQNGFAPLGIILVLAAALTLSITSFSMFKPGNKNKQDIVQNVSITPTASTTPTTKPKITSNPTSPPITDKPSTATINAVISDNGNPIGDTSLELRVRNENTQVEQIFKNTTSAWIIKGVIPGKYKITVPFTYKKYFNPERNCEGCREKEDKSDFEICGYVMNLQAGDNVKIYCMLRTTHPLNVPGTSADNSGPGPDTTAPNTNVYYPQPNGSITYKIDGKVCAITTAPNDDQGPNGIETEYRFDDGSWSGYAGGRGYLCADSLSNGPHTLSYHSKDKAGNVENTKTLQFTVNITGN